VLRRSPLLLPVSDEALAGAPIRLGRAIVVPIAVDASGPLAAPHERDIAAITYAADAHKKGLDRVLEAWALARRDGEELLVAGGAAMPALEGVRALGALERSAYRDLLRRSRIYVAAPRREEYGLAQLEALADGAMLVTGAPDASYAALALARDVDPRLVAGELASAIRTALDDPMPGYARAVAPALARFSAASVDRVVAEQVLPLLFGGA
jgi:glycosyltransferase involved in cell wall biosynthesis